MGCNWTQASLGDLISYIGKGIAPKYTEASEGAIMVLGQKCVRNQAVDYSQARFHNQILKSFREEKRTLRGDILVNATGVGSAGRVAQVMGDPQRECITDGHVITLRASGIDPYYLGYFVKSKQTAIEQMAEGSTGQTEMNRQRLQNEVIVTFPEDRKMQHFIANVGLAFDRKISLNNRLNGYLADLVAVEFRKRFESNVPTVELGDVLSISTKTLKPQDHGGEIWEHYSIPSYDENRRPVFEQACCIKSNKYLIDSECILISKLNPSIKRIWMPACTSGRAVCSTEFIVYRPNNPEHRSFYYAAIDAPEFTDYLLAHVTGSTGSRQRTQPKATLAYPMQNPGNASIDDFCKFADPLYQQIQMNELESIRMEELRDTLLPKLMSGEIDVSKVDLTQLNSHLADC